MSLSLFAILSLSMLIPRNRSKTSLVLNEIAQVVDAIEHTHTKKTIFLLGSAQHFEQINFPKK